MDDTVRAKFREAMRRKTCAVCSTKANDVRKHGEWSVPLCTRCFEETRRPGFHPDPHANEDDFDPNDVSLGEW